MSHRIFGERFLGRREPAWHGLGQVFREDESLSVTDAFERAGLMYRFEKVPLEVPLPDGSHQQVDPVAVMREPTPDDPVWRCVAVVDPTFGIIQHVDLARQLDPLSARWPVETVGALEMGKTCFVTLKTGAYDIAKDQVERYLLISDGKGGDHALRIALVDIRVVCHAKGTPIIDGQWRGIVENHPSAHGTIRGPGREVLIRGLPFAERVSDNHRYWARQRRRSLSSNEVAKRAAVQDSVAVAIKTTAGTDIAPDWVHAEDLQSIVHEIGMPIDTSEETAPAIPVAHVLSSGWTREWDSQRARAGGGTFDRTIWAVERDPRLQSRVVVADGLLVG